VHERLEIVQLGNRARASGAAMVAIGVSPEVQIKRIKTIVVARRAKTPEMS
jgi:hypothetical protein